MKRLKLILPLLFLFVAATTAKATLTLSVTSFTATSITMAISGTFDANTTGQQVGWFAIKHNWSSSSHVHTEWFTNTPTVTACSIVAGSVSYTTSTVYVANSSYSFADSIYIQNTTQSTA